MSYTPTTEYMSQLGFISQKDDKACYRVWTSQTGKHQIRVHRSPDSTWLDFYQRIGQAGPWRKQAADPTPATEQDFRYQLASLGWLLAGVSAYYTLTLATSSPAASRIIFKTPHPHLAGLGYATWSSLPR